jgi:hypothetical protein
MDRHATLAMTMLVCFHFLFPLAGAVIGIVERRAVAESIAIKSCFKKYSYSPSVCVPFNVSGWPSRLAVIRNS